MKPVFHFLAVGAMALSMIGCGSSKDQPETAAELQALDVSGEARFVAEKAPTAQSSYACDWTKPQKYKADSRIQVGMRFVSRGQTVGKSGASQGKIETTIVSVESQRLISDMKVLEARGKTNGIKAGDVLRTNCWVQKRADGGEQIDCSMTPEPAGGLHAQDRCYVRSQGKPGDLYETEYTLGKFRLASGVEVPAEMERRVVKGTLFCATEGKPLDVDHGPAQEVRVTVRSRVVPSKDLEACESGTPVYGYREIVEEGGKLFDGDLDELVEAPVVNP